MQFITDNLRRHRLVIRQFLKFGITGTIGALVDFGIYTVLTRGLGWDVTFEVLGVRIIAANMVSVFLAIISNFLLNKFWTFRDKDDHVAQQWATYFAFNTVTWVLNQILTSFFTFKVILLATIFGDQKDFIAKALAIGIIMFVNFLGSKFLIFKTQTRRVQPGTLG